MTETPYTQIFTDDSLTERIDWTVNHNSEVITITITRDIIYAYFWWIFLTAISLYNILRLSTHWRNWFIGKYTSSFQSKMLYLSTVYTFVCAARAVWPRKDVDRACFFDHLLSTVIIGRSIATVAELCFVKQLSMVIARFVNKYVQTNKGSYINGYKYYFWIIFVAEIFSWIGIATKAQIWNGFEETIWLCVGLHLTISCVYIMCSKHTKKTCTQSDKECLLWFIVLGALYCAFMAFIDVPMYVQRFAMDNEKGVNYLWFSDGIIELMSCKMVVRSFDIWWEDIPWMTCYFSGGVWTSQYFINIPMSDSKDKNE